MEKMLTEVCDYLNNYFWRIKRAGKFTISGGSITIPECKDGQYFRIVGSVFNDGVHKYPADNLTDEEFEGSIWLMAVPQTVINLTSDIEEWNAKYGGVVTSPYSSESFGNYSYSKSINSRDSGDSTVTWQSAFADRLYKWRRLRGAR